MKVAVVQLKPRKGDVEANLRAVGDAFEQLAGTEPPDLILFPEAALTGYFLEGAVYDLAFDADDLATQLAALWRSRGAGSAPVDVALGFYENADGTYYNSAMYLEIAAHGERVVHVHRKLFLPTYGVFDEERFLSRGRRMRAFDTRFGAMALLVCEDAWHAIVPTIAAVQGARVLLIPSASPGRGLSVSGELETVTRWKALLRLTASEHGVYVLYAGLTGFEGGKGMTGSSCVVDPRGEIVALAPPLGACIIRAAVDDGEIDAARASLPLLGDLQSVLPDLLAEPLGPDE